MFKYEWRIIIMSQINVRNLSNENNDGAPDIVGVSTFSATSYFVPPVGNTADRPENPQDGDLRFNTDRAGLEYYRMNHWELVEMTTPDLGGISEGFFVDSSSYGRVVTTVGGVTHSTTQKKIGSTSIYRPSTPNSCIHVPDSSDFDWGTNDWTLECWIRRDAQGSDEWLMAHSDGTGANTSIGLHIWSSSVANSNKVNIRMRQSSSNIDCTGTTALAANTWYHVAGVRDGNTLRLYINGVQENTTSISGSPDTSSAPFAFTALRTNGDSGLTGYMDEIRVSKSCRYTSGTTFTPSTTAFTSDSNTLVLIHSDSGSESSGGMGARAVYGGGYSPQHPTIVKTIGYLSIPTLGNASDFGDMTTAYMQAGACSSRTRGIIAGGRTPSFVQDIEYITISSTGNGTDFGGNLNSMYTPGSCSSETRGIFGNGYVPSSPNYVNSIDYITIASTGKNANDFGDLSVARGYGHWCSSSTRGLSMGGYNGTAALNTIDYVTITTTGNATDFGDLSAINYDNSSASNSTRGFSLGGNSPAGTNTIEYVTIASTGNASNFGDLTQTTLQQCAATNPTRLVRMGGVPDTSSWAATNTVDYITIATTGDATDWGDLVVPHRLPWGVSNAHGGL